MPRPRLDPDQLAHILRAAAAVIAAKRSDNLRLVDVARIAGVSTGTLQHYFDSREGLIDATFHWVSSTELARCQELAARETDADRRLEVVADALIGTADDWALWSELWALQSRSPERFADAPDIFDAWLALLTEAIVRATAGRPTLLGDSGSTALFLLRYVEGLGVQILMKRISRANAVEHLRWFMQTQITSAIIDLQPGRADSG
ncbi:TetR/AcrR family transcriptional regulator [Mycobacterium sp. NPDC003323]